MVSQLCLMCGSTSRRSCLGARPRYNLVVNEDVKKPNKQTNIIITITIIIVIIIIRLRLLLLLLLIIIIIGLLT